MEKAFPDVVGRAMEGAREQWVGELCPYVEAAEEVVRSVDLPRYGR
jgi:hypothetical protein